MISTSSCNEIYKVYIFSLALSVQSNDIDLPFSNSILTIKCVTMYARNWQEMSISHEVEDNKPTTLVVVNWNLGSPSVNINSNFTSEVSYKEDALLLTIHSKEVDCSYLGSYTCRLALPEQNYQNTTVVKGKAAVSDCSVLTNLHVAPLKYSLKFFFVECELSKPVIYVFAFYKTFTSA